MTADLTTFKTLGEALALGLLVGIERFRGREPGEKRSAGVRTFAIISLLGAVCGLYDALPLTVATFAGVAALVVFGYHRSQAESVGLTTEFAALLVFWIGVLLSTHETAAISLGIVLTIFLASKKTLHHFVRDQISEAEFEATLRFLAVVLVVYPLLPDRPIGPYGVLNPSHVWGMVILVSTISYLGYFLVRWLGRRRGLMLGSLVGGLVSTTAVTVSLAERSRQASQSGRQMGVVAVLANAVQGPRLFLLLWVVDRELAANLAAPLFGMAVVGVAGAWLLARRAGTEMEVDFPLRNPYSLKPALKFGLFFTTILLTIRLAGQRFGEEGTLLASAIAGAGSASAAALSVSRLFGDAALPSQLASVAVIVAISTNALAKWVLALLHGSRPMALWLGGGLLTMVATAFALLFVGL